MLSKKTKYAIKALVLLGKYRDKPPLQIAWIAEQEMIPKSSWNKYCWTYGKPGFYTAKKGAGGGYSLNKDPKDIYLVNILRITDGPIAMVPCASLNFYHRCDECHQETTCGIRDVFIQVRDASLKILTETSIADIIDRETNLIGSPT